MNPPPSPFYETDDAEDDLVSDKENKKVFTREVRKVARDEDEVDYYNEWIMSNVG